MQGFVEEHTGKEGNNTYSLECHDTRPTATQKEHAQTKQPRI